MIRTHDGQRGGTDGAGGVAVNSRPSHLHRIDSDVRLAAPLEKVFAFFADAANLELLTPAWLHFRILSPLPLPMAVGTRIDYRLRLRGVPIRWQSEITAWEPPCRFVDEQRRGPYRVWIHEHRFAEEHREGCEPVVVASDRVDYAVPGGRLANRLLVARDLRRIFAYRGDRLRERFGLAAE